ncbi:hypothetical protein [Methylomagnum sp.]
MSIGTKATAPGHLAALVSIRTKATAPGHLAALAVDPHQGHGQPGELPALPPPSL